MTRRWLERIAAPPTWPVERKTRKFIAVPRGPHTTATSIPLMVVIRDILQLAQTAKEARRIIKAGRVLVDGRQMRDVKYGLGLMDIIEVRGVGVWRLVPGKRLRLVPTAGRDAQLKLCKIIGKTTQRHGKCQINLHDGRNLLTDQPCRPGDSLLLELPGQKILERLALEPGALVLITAGSAVGKLTRLQAIECEFDRAWLDIGEAPLTAILVVGKEEPVIRLS